jgi:hypothetical protein
MGAWAMGASAAAGGGGGGGGDEDEEEGRLGEEEGTERAAAWRTAARDPALSAWTGAAGEAALPQPASAFAADVWALGMLGARLLAACNALPSAPPPRAPPPPPSATNATSATNAPTQPDHHATSGRRQHVRGGSTGSGSGSGSGLAGLTGRGMLSSGCSCSARYSATERMAHARRARSSSGTPGPCPEAAALGTCPTSPPPAPPAIQLPAGSRVVVASVPPPPDAAAASWLLASSTSTSECPSLTSAWAQARPTQPASAAVAPSLMMIVSTDLGSSSAATAAAADEEPEVSQRTAPPAPAPADGRPARQAVVVHPSPSRHSAPRPPPSCRRHVSRPRSISGICCASRTTERPPPSTARLANAVTSSGRYPFSSPSRPSHAVEEGDVAATQQRAQQPVRQSARSAAQPLISRTKTCEKNQFLLLL